MSKLVTEAREKPSNLVVTIKKQGLKLTCKRCNYCWIYFGKNSIIVPAQIAIQP